MPTKGYEVVDCTGLVITPGLIDAHSHVGVFEEGTSASHVHDGNETTEAAWSPLYSRKLICEWSKTSVFVSSMSIFCCDR